ncbi:transglutaminase-like cysteine peptidase [Sphingomonas sp. CCH9-F2]|uniref:transglutaminase-like cysteine peptidase n=1 Tax=Sphingomonas sp. CCH9-F2 TaxID=1768778 RepID=UPI00082ADCCB|nr:transglutaminase-like cysteine peptidase [Sphingomonas sp. CCH9-F2]
MALPNLSLLMAAATALACGLAPGGADARARQPAFLPGGAVADPPAGFVDFCARDTVSCAAGLSPDRLPALTLAATGCATGEQCAQPWSAAAMVTGAIEPGATLPAAALLRPAVVRSPAPTMRPAVAPADLLATVKRVNSQVNRRVIQVSDRDARGIDEYWERPAAGKHPVGDCEDIAIEKRMTLVEGGFPPELLFLAVVFKQGFGLHTVLIARLPDGDRVLDSLSGHLRRWNETRYVWLRQQRADAPMEWHRIGGLPNVTLVSQPAAGEGGRS